MKTLTVQKRKRRRREVCRGRRRTSRRRRVTHPSIVSRHTTPPHQPSNTGTVYLGEGRKQRAGVPHKKLSLSIELNTNGVTGAAAAATGERNETVSLWLSLILQRCLCHHGREIGGLGALLHTCALEGRLAGRITGGERWWKTPSPVHHADLPTMSWWDFPPLFWLENDLLRKAMSCRSSHQQDSLRIESHHLEKKQQKEENDVKILKRSSVEQTTYCFLLLCGFSCVWEMCVYCQCQRSKSSLPK